MGEATLGYADNYLLFLACKPFIFMQLDNIYKLYTYAFSICLGFIKKSFDFLIQELDFCLW